MKTKMEKTGDTLVVSIQGKIDYETQEPLKRDLEQLLAGKRTDSSPKKIIFDLNGLEFVGSSGITNLVQTLKDFNTRTPIRPQYCNVRSEFKKVIKALDETDGFDFTEIENSIQKSAAAKRKSYDQ